jgi:hypothetical protein
VKAWVHLPVTFDPKRDRWTTTIRTPGSRSFRRIRADTYPEIITLYLAHSFDRESLRAAADMAATRETMIERVNSIRYQHRKEDTHE